MAAHSHLINQSSPPLSRNRECHNPHVLLGITWRARTRDLVKLDITQTDTVNSPEGCSDIRRAPWVMKWWSFGSFILCEICNDDPTSSISEQSLRQSSAWCSSERALLSTWEYTLNSWDCGGWPEMMKDLSLLVKIWWKGKIRWWRVSRLIKIFKKALPASPRHLPG